MGEHVSMRENLEVALDIVEGELEKVPVGSEIYSTLRDVHKNLGWSLFLAKSYEEQID